MGVLRLQSLNTSLAATGTAGRIHFAWANKFQETFILGFGIEAGIASGTENPDWALSAKLGISQNLGTLGPFSEFTWNVALTNLGKEMLTPGGTYYRSPFTPRAGVSAAVDFSDDFQLHSAINLAVPGFTDLLLNLQTSLVFFKTLSLSFSWGFDLVQQIDNRYQNASLLPRVSVSYSLLHQEAPDIDSTVSIYSPYRDHIGFALGAAFPLQRVDREGPEIQLSIPETIYISPNNDGTQDSWSGDIIVDDESGIAKMELHILKNAEERFSQIWELEPVREENIGGFIQEIFQAVQTVIIPESIFITGKDNDGLTLPDGSYEIEIDAVDILGNSSSLTGSTLLSDTEPPNIEITALSSEEKVFSPNGDGNKDFLRINQTGSSEDLWNMEVYDSAGKLVWNENLENASPLQFDWNGHNNNGERLPDGVYRYQISSRDRSGNRGIAEVTNIIINSVVSPVRIDLADSHFSPNGDGIKDTIGFLPRIESRTGIKQWKIEILDDRERPIGELKDTGPPAAQLAFDGLIPSSGQTLSEGRYRARFILEYVSGNRPQALSSWFTLDLTPPEIEIEFASDLFSPNNDGRSDEFLIYQQSSDEPLWEGAIITDKTSQTIKNFAFRGKVKETLSWDGRNETGMLAPDGMYVYQISATDEAGNTSLLRSTSFILDTADAEVLLSAAYDAFSPNGDGIKEVQEFIPRVSNNDQVQLFTLEILNGEQVLRRIDGSGATPEKIDWDGRDSEGALVPDGTYSARLRVELLNRSIGEGRTGPFTVDTEYPMLEVESDYLIFSPNGDNKRDTLPIRQKSTAESLYSATIYDSSGDPVKEYFWENALQSFEWMGRDRFDNLAPDGIYRYVIQVEDSAGNLSETEITDIELDSRNISVFLTLNETGISPNGDGFKDELEIGLHANVSDGVDRWTLGIYAESGKLIWEARGSRLQTQSSLTFDGRNNSGELVEGNFYALFNVFYTKGDAPEARSATFTVDLTGPELQAEISPLPFSPDGDGRADVLNLDLASDDPSGINNWHLSIYDRVDNIFQEFTSTEAPEERIRWDGLAKNGELVTSAEDYRYVFEATDNLGNNSSIEGIIPIDILVICTRDKDRCKIQISDINFEPNSPELILGGTETGIKNQSIISRLSEVLEKYSQYQITIEGHANRTRPNDPTENEELMTLSTGRAESVKTQLIGAGIDTGRISIVGKGGTEPLAPFSDENNRWKNRRVEFILVR